VCDLFLFLLHTLSIEVCVCVQVVVEQSREGLDATKSVFEEVCDGQESIDLSGTSVAGRAYVSWHAYPLIYIYI